MPSGRRKASNAMAETSKSLHVSYGSFSCTLEGFADPVAAMIAVTEHFRELAARDLQFAASGTMPRAEDLDRLAQRVRAEAGLADEAALPAGETGFGPAAVLGPVAVSAGEDAGGTPLDDGGAMAAVPDDGADRELEADPTDLRPAGARVQEKQKTLSAPPDEDDALARILTESAMRLSDPEAMRRRSTMASLKAAVAATEAARARGERPEAELEARRDRFRQDVRQVEDEVHGVEHAPARSPASPLRLVASQRVDLGAEEAVALPVAEEISARPVPVRSVEQPVDQPLVLPAAHIVAQPVSLPVSRSAAGEPEADFASFAARMGATTLPDLIEAAAAWRSFVWSRTDVSRPELLQLASEALPGEPSREEGLGAFGTLLNDGRLARVGSGRFRVSEESRFNPGKLAG